jgi:hypothetical protein
MTLSTSNPDHGEHQAVTQVVDEKATSLASTDPKKSRFSKAMSILFKPVAIAFRYLTMIKVNKTVIIDLQY